MIANEVRNLEIENMELKTALEELKNKMEQDAVLKPKSCQYCENYVQHYAKINNDYIRIHAGHCISGAKVKKGGKRNPFPDDTCPYFKLGTEKNYCV